MKWLSVFKLEVDVPKGKTDYRGINIAAVIAHAFEKCVYFYLERIKMMMMMMIIIILFVFK